MHRAGDARGGLPLDLDAEARTRVLDAVAREIECQLEAVAERAVTPSLSPAALRDRLARYDFAAALPPEQVLDDAIALLRDGIVHTTHPGYFGLFNPAPTFMGVVADTLTAAFNPQLAASSHAPAPVAVEHHVLGFIGERIGWGDVAGSFTTGGAEANQTAVLAAITRAMPAFAAGGARALDRRPLLYASADSHLALLKIAHASGIGRDAVRLVPVDQRLRLDVAALQRMLVADRAADGAPFLVVATAGTTGTGAIDDLEALAGLCEAEGLWLHVDAAWGGAAILSDRLRPVLRGIDRADSVTIDAHKWLSVPMGAGMLLCRHGDALGAAFGVQTGYMPPASDELPDPYTHSAQWSRRFIGLKLFLSLAVAGRAGYARQIEHDCALADELRAQLDRSGWRVVNDTPLPVVCCVDAARPDDAALHRSIVDRAVASGRVWVSAVQVGGRIGVRACVTNHRSTSADAHALVQALADARHAAS